MKKLLKNLSTQSQDFGHAVSIITTSAAAGITLTKAINKNEKIGAVIGIGTGLLIYSMFNPRKKLRNENQRLEKEIKKITDRFEK